MKRAIVALAVVALLAACGDSGTRAAATVGATQITSKQVLDELSAIGANDAYVKFIADSTQGQTVVFGDAKKHTYTSEFVSDILTRQIESSLVEQEMARRKVVVTDDCRTAAQTKLEGQVANTATEGKVVFAAFRAAYRADLVRWGSEQLALEAALAKQRCVTPTAIQQYYNLHKADYREACVSHILVASQQAAEAIYAQLQGGADFASLAKADSTDGSAANGGQLGCAPRGSYVQEFDDAVWAAKVGVPTKPVQSQFGWHVILVSRFEDPPLADVAPQIEIKLETQAGSFYDSWLRKAQTSTQISVSPAYGVWDAATGRVDPPAVATKPGTTTTTGVG